MGISDVVEVDTVAIGAVLFGPHQGSQQYFYFIFQILSNFFLFMTFNVLFLKTLVVLHEVEI